MKYDLNPTMIIIAGSPGTGKTTLARSIARKVPTSFVLEKDVINVSLSEVRPTTNGDLPSVSEYLESHYTEIERDILGDVIRIPRRSEFYGRHVRDQTYRAMIDIALRNLEVGKSPILESILTRQFAVEGLVEGLFETFKDYPTGVLLTYLPEGKLRRRITERMEGDEEKRVLDIEKVKNDPNWYQHLEKFPIIPSEICKFHHHLVNTENTPETCVENAVSYLQSL